MGSAAGVAASLLVLLVAARAGGDTDSLRSTAAVTFSTLVTTPLPVEGLTADAAGNLYTVGRALTPTAPCPVWRINVTSRSLAVVGQVTAPCSPSGVALNAHGDLFIADGDNNVLTLTPDDAAPPFATVFAASVPGTNGLAFDRDGNLWTGDGIRARGRVWRISPVGDVTEIFRVQPTRNGTAFGGAVAGDGVGRQARNFPPGTVANTQGGQDVVVNGLAVTKSGDLLVADTARGAIWRVSFDAKGEVKNRTGCDTTFTPNTLCLDSIAVQHPLLQGADGIALDEAGNVYVVANERNAIVVVTNSGEIVELFRNPVAVTKLRNEGPLEFPTSPILLGHMFCTANTDVDRRDNSPSTAGELPASGRGKVSCIDQRLNVPGLPLPIR